MGALLDGRFSPVSTLASAQNQGRRQLLGVNGGLLVDSFLYVIPLGDVIKITLEKKTSGIFSYHRYLNSIHHIVEISMSYNVFFFLKKRKSDGYSN